MSNFNRVNVESLDDRLNMLEVQIDGIKAHVDQKFDEFLGAIDDLESRINNLR